MSLAGLLWFNFLGVVHVKGIFDPLYKVLGLAPQTSKTSTSKHPVFGDLDQDRMDKQLESLTILRQELDKRESDIALAEKQNQQIAQELADRQKAQEEREETFNSEIRKYEDRDANISQIAANLNGMAPQNAVNILVAMDDQMVIDVLRKVEAEAQASKSSSMVSFWLSLMPAERAATIQRKMTEKPESLLPSE
ncbi:MAG: flagellar protein FlbB [Treponema sp.]|nr:flagellar protein FlbB [Treponema sp.]